MDWHAIPHQLQNVPWDQVFGLKAAKESLQRNVFFPVKFPSFYRGECQPTGPTCVLLYGPSGCGKLHLAKAVATALYRPLFIVDMNCVMAAMTKHNEVEQAISELFSVAAGDITKTDIADSPGPSIIFFKDIDLLFDRRDRRRTGEFEDRMKAALLVQLAGENGYGLDNRRVIVIAGTSSPMDLEYDPDFLAKFALKIEIPPPDGDARREIFAANGIPHPTAAVVSYWEIERMCDETEGFSAAYIKDGIRRAFDIPIKHVQKAKFFFQDESGMFVPTREGFPGAMPMTWLEIPDDRLATMRVTAQNLYQMFETEAGVREDLEMYEDWTKKHHGVLGGSRDLHHARPALEEEE